MSLGRSGASGILTGGNPSLFLHSQSTGGPGLPAAVTLLNPCSAAGIAPNEHLVAMGCSCGLLRVYSSLGNAKPQLHGESCFQCWQKGRAELKQLFYIYSEKLSFRNC